MPLPTDGTIHLTAYSRPGETCQSRPKQAMILRMSDKTLDLLESIPQLHFDFSENPGLTIGDTFFPVTSVQETTPHDLYLRTSSAAKRNAPLKLYANVTGKFVVGRQLNDRITGKLRASAADAEKQRATTKSLDPNELPKHNGKKPKKEPTSNMFRKPVRPADQPLRPPPSTSATTPPGGASPAPPPPPRNDKAYQALRSRMIRCIASAERTSDQVVKMVGGNECSTTTKGEILQLLDEIAEPVPLPNNSRAPKNYRLKTESWLQVRPYEIPGLSETERTNLARAAKFALRNLKIPETDPAWAHVQYRNSNGITPRNQPINQTGGSSKAGQASDPPKSGIMSTQVKKKNPKHKSSGEAMVDKAKNEGLAIPSSRPSTSSSTRDDDLNGRSLPQKPPPARRGPGSGFKAKQPTPTESREFASGRSPVINGKAILGESPSSTQDPRRSQNSSASQSSERKTSGAPSQKIDKLRRDDAAASDSERSDLIRNRDRDRDRDRDREGGLKSKEREREDRERDRREREREREREKERDRDKERRDAEKQREKERARRREFELENDREREGERFRKKGRDRDLSQEREEGERSDDDFRTLKRKGRDDDDYESPSRTMSSSKKPRMDSPAPKNTKLRDPGLPKKPELDPPPPPKGIKRESPQPPRLPKIKKEFSKEPTPIPKVPAASTKPSSPIASSKPKGSIKRRRGSDIYTSSEDEGEMRPLVKRENPSATIPPSNGNNHRNNDASTQSRSHTSRLPPTDDHATLRERYETSYIPYLGSFQLLMKHKTKFYNILKKMDRKGSSGSVTESDGDGDLLDPDEFWKLAKEYHTQQEDLENIQRIFSKHDQIA